MESLEKSGNLKQNSKSQGKCHKIPKVREFYCVKFIFSQLENPNIENFLEEHTPAAPLNGLRLTVEFNPSLENSWQSQGILSLLESRIHV